MAGDYFFRIAVGQRTSELEGIPVPIMFSIAVDGEVSGVPEFAEVSDEQTAQPETPSESPTQEESPVSPEPADPTGEVMDAPADEPAPVEGQEPDAADSTDATPSDGVSPLAVVGGALVGVGVLGAVGYGIHRRRQG